MALCISTERIHMSRAPLLTLNTLAPVAPSAIVHGLSWLTQTGCSESIERLYYRMYGSRHCNDPFSLLSDSTLSCRPRNSKTS